MKLLITGCRGFLGGAFGRHAAQNGDDVLGVSRATQAPADWRGQYVSGDVVSADLTRLVREFQPEAIFHGAGTASVGGSFVAPLEDLRASVLAWTNLLDAVRRSGLRPLLLFPSSAAVYGNPQSLPVAEDAAVDPISPYGFHKAACELIAREYADCFGARIMVCRFFSIFGETQRRLFVWEIYRQLINDAAIAHLQGTGRETRDYLHVEDAISALAQLAQSTIAASDETRFKVLNVASGVETNMLDLANEMRRLLGSEKQIECRNEELPGDPQRWRADASRLRSAIPNWRPKSLAERLKQCLAAWQSEAKPC